MLRQTRKGLQGRRMGIGEDFDDHVIWVLMKRTIYTYITAQRAGPGYRSSLDPKLLCSIPLLEHSDILFTC